MTLVDKRSYVNKSYDFSFKDSKPFFYEKDLKNSIKNIFEEINEEIKNIEYSITLGNRLKIQAGKKAFSDIEIGEKFAIEELKKIKEIIKKEIGELK